MTYQGKEVNVLSQAREWVLIQHGTEVPFWVNEKDLKRTVDVSTRSKQNEQKTNGLM